MYCKRDVLSIQKSQTTQKKITIVKCILIWPSLDNVHFENYFILLKSQDVPLAFTLVKFASVHLMLIQNLTVCFT